MGQEASQARCVCDRIHRAASSASRGRKRCSFPRSPGGQAGGCTHTRIHPSLSHPVIPACFERSVWEFLCSCWHETMWLLRGRIPSVLKISLCSICLSAGNSPHSWRISFVFLCFPFPLRAEGSGTAFSQAAPTLGCSELPTQHLHPVHIWMCPDVAGQECCQPFAVSCTYCCLLQGDN